ncbi:hypothetical protein CTAYLR_001392 [Chrysophaeum taylorii]|uniref:Uncharacterized protein n=1 Tax=Chrysophaeum taylorii TaxID=2483200 RepID=A0AAD7U554_9STRA|nr:hypothetical protein CTAYLR_001392 [Chrysophaeum taylorii]
MKGLWKVLAICGVKALLPTETSLGKLLLQRSVQTQVVYLTEFHDEVKAEWLSTFLSPCAPLGTVRLSQRECKPEYHGLDAFTDWHVENYLSEMMAAAPSSYAVRYAIGTPDASPPATGEGMDDEAARKAMEMWGNDSAQRAAQSRRNNPYLKKQEPKYIEYNETIVPSRAAQLLMQTREQLAGEWATDVAHIGVGKFDEYLSCLDDDEPCSALEDVVDDVLVETSYALAVRNTPMAVSEVSSPLRSGSLDLCDRLATREAATYAAATLLPEEAEWLRKKLQLEDEPADDIHSALRAATCKIVQVDALSGHARRRGLAIRWLRDLERSEAPPGVDPLYVASVVRHKRREIATSWAADIVDNVKTEHADLLKTSLEKSLLAN